MEKILLLLALMDNPSDEFERRKELESKEKKAAPIEHRPIKICTKQIKDEDCRILTQAEISSGAVRGNKEPVDNQQP